MTKKLCIICKNPVLEDGYMCSSCYASLGFMVGTSDPHKFMENVIQWAVNRTLEEGEE